MIKQAFYSLSVYFKSINLIRPPYWIAMSDLAKFK